jgi:uncharacterized protein YuzB (UPF0349 family)
VLRCRSMRVELCKKSIERPEGQELVAALQDREHTVVVKDCLNRCQGCNLGLFIAVAEGAPLSGKTADKILAAVDELAEDA